MNYISILLEKSLKCKVVASGGCQQMTMRNRNMELTHRHVFQVYSPSLTKKKKKTGGIKESLSISEPLSSKYSAKDTE